MRIKAVVVCQVLGGEKIGNACIDILRAAKALVVNQPIIAWQNMAEFGSGMML